jgi:hypothetical protein
MRRSYRTRVVWGGGGGPRAMLWAGMGRSYRTRVVWGGCVPRAMLWAGIGRSYRTRVVWGGCVTQSGGLGWHAVSRWDTGRGARGEGRGARGEGRGVESLGGAGPGGWLRESGSGLPVFGALGWLVRRGGGTGVCVIYWVPGRAASGSRRALVVIEVGLDMPAAGLRNSM